MKTFEQLIQSTLRRLSQVTGVGVQLYSEERIAEYLGEKFDFVFTELWWPDYMEWFEREVDGVQGVLTQPISDVRRFEDIRAVWAGNSVNPLPVLPAGQNPAQLKGGTRIRYYSARRYDPATAVDRRLQFWPKTAQGSVQIHARVHPGDFYLNSEVVMDSELLINGAAYAYAEDDGTNPGQVQKFQIAFETRLEQLRRELLNKPFILDSRSGEFPTEWWEH